MAKYIYARVSTTGQHFEQQMQDINAYFSTHDIKMQDITDTIEEKESGGTSYTDRELSSLLDRCVSGDTIYAASTDRLGRNFVDMIRMMESARQRGINIIACKQGLSLADDSVATKIILSVTAIIDEDERMRIRHRVQNGVRAALAELKRDGMRETRSGTVQTSWGNVRGIGTDVANEASCIKRLENAIKWRSQSDAVIFAIRKYSEGWNYLQITKELGKMYDDRARAKPNEPNIYATKRGFKPNICTISRWIKQASLI